MRYKNDSLEILLETRFISLFFPPVTFILPVRIISFFYVSYLVSEKIERTNCISYDRNSRHTRSNVAR